MWSWIIPGFKKTYSANAMTDTSKGSYYSVDTRRFMDPSAPRNQMNSPQAKVYVPNQCKAGHCKLHVHLHGCNEGGKIWDYIEKDGFMEYAAANDIVILFPFVLDDGKFDIWHMIEKCWHVDQKLPVQNDYQTQFILKLVSELQK